jgi:hypothetical protein
MRGAVRLTAITLIAIGGAIMVGGAALIGYGLIAVAKSPPSLNEPEGHGMGLIFGAGILFAGFVVLQIGRAIRLGVKGEKGREPKSPVDSP